MIDEKQHINKLVTAIKGSRDFYPDKWVFNRWLYSKIKETSLKYGYQEYEAPIIERLELYVAKSGEELVKKQAFVIKNQKGELLALRPELTPSLARMIAQRETAFSFPVRWFSFGRFFRYEKPQKGRGREFFQWNIDMLGADSFLADTEMILIAIDFFSGLGLGKNDLRIKINSREVLEKRLAGLGIAKEKFKDIIRIIDKKDKVEKEIFEEMFVDEGIKENEVTNFINVLFSNDFSDSPRLVSIFEMLKNLKAEDFVEFDPTIARGLDYYTGIVFEGWESSKRLRAIFGGGRYDNLVNEVGGKTKISGIGFAMGDMVIEELLSLYNKLPVLSIDKPKVLVTVFSEKTASYSAKIAEEIRNEGIPVEVYPKADEKLGKQFKYASDNEIHLVVVLGPDEIQRNEVTIKNMLSRKQKSSPLDKIVVEIRTFIGKS